MKTPEQKAAELEGLPELKKVRFLKRIGSEIDKAESLNVVVYLDGVADSVANAAILDLRKVGWHAVLSEQQGYPGFVGVQKCLRIEPAGARDIDGEDPEPDDPFRGDSYPKGCGPFGFGS